MISGKTLRGSAAFSVLTVLLAWANPASAHPGHDPMSHGMGHLLTSPYHLAILAGFGCIVFASALLVRGRRGRIVARVAGAVTVAIAAVVWMMR